MASSSLVGGVDRSEMRWPMPIARRSSGSSPNMATGCCTPPLACAAIGSTPRISLACGAPPARGAAPAPGECDHSLLEHATATTGRRTAARAAWRGPRLGGYARPRPGSQLEALWATAAENLLAGAADRLRFAPVDRDHCAHSVRRGYHALTDVFPGRGFSW